MPRLRLTLLLLLAIATKPGERHRIEALLGDIESAHLAQAVLSRRDSPERVVELADPEPLTLGQHSAHLSLNLFGEIAAVHRAAFFLSPS
jgi:hypothetical protein